MEDDALEADVEEAGLDLSVQFRELPVLAMRRKVWIVTTLMVAVGLGLAYLQVAPSVYNVGARLLVQPRDVPLQEEARRLGGGTFLATQAEIINSATVIRAALEAVPDPGSEFVGSQEERLEAVLESFSVTPVDRTNVLTLSHWSADPDTGVQIVEATIESYRRFVRDTGHGELEALQILTRKEEELRAAVDRAEGRYQSYRAESELVGTTGQGFDGQKAMLSRLGDQLLEAKTRRLEIESQLQTATARQSQLAREASNGRPDVVIDGVGSAPDSGSGFAADVEKIEQELWQAKMHVASLSQSYGDAHPQVREARQRVAMWEGRMADSLDADRASLQQQAKTARTAERRLNALYRGEIAKTKALDSQQLEEKRLLEEVQRVRAAHHSILGKLSQWELTLEAVTQLQGGIAIRVLEGPGLRVAKVWPNPVLVLAPCAFVGLVGGLLLAIIVDRTRGEPA